MSTFWGFELSTGEISPKPPHFAFLFIHVADFFNINEKNWDCN